jgi:hypothetical protein
VWIVKAENQGFTMNIRRHVDRRQSAWIGLARVKPRVGNKTLSSAAGAVVPVLALALNQDDFVTKAVTTLNRYEFDVMEIENVELYAKRMAKYKVADHIALLAKSLSENAPVAFGPFHSYMKE